MDANERRHADNRRHNQRYGRRHRRVREVVAAQVAAGGVACARCGQPIAPNETFDLGHADGDDPHAYRGPEHRECNRSTHGRERPLAAPAQPQPVTSRWWLTDVTPSDITADSHTVSSPPVF